MMTYKQTGRFPSSIPEVVSDSELAPVIPGTVSEASVKYEQAKNLPLHFYLMIIIYLNI